MRRYRVNARFYAVVAVALAIVFGVSFFVARGRLMDAARALEEKQAQRSAVSQQVGALQDELTYAQTDDYIERAARDELGMIYPGEFRYVGGR
ncbi:MAG: FtsB family cell division protein [Christensenellales bacterium]|jgi:cell division protein FtsB